MDDSTELDEWEFIGRRGGAVSRLVPGEVLFADPQVKVCAQAAGRELLFDFTDDRAVLSMLRSRHDDEEVMFSNGTKWGVPLAVIGLFAVIYWAGVVRYWESSAARNGYLAIASVLILLLVFFFIRSAVKTWGDKSRQNLRSRAHKYRELAHAARRAGMDVPNRYPHYGPYPFAANFHRETALAESGEERER
ncbi:hypothetical protein GUR47_18065 [Streptomyces tendae]|uniref:Uncharacterized protein n=1 Tax=Streptomyces tendae TaxID=1932 RepID=A0A6B3QR51_STRTE|nr:MULTISPECIES: hypothetical protein [Streptomyces]MZG14106.1 hypothetical protein [Streptomyces sp. SID5914]NEV88564.1 hypothetical protein [Streptomyces tendae]